MEELYRQLQASPLASRLLRARVLQLLAGQMLRCAEVIASDAYPPAQRTAAGDFLISALDWAHRLAPRREPKYYEVESMLLCRVAAGSCLELLPDAVRNGHFSSQRFKIIRKKAQALGAFDWRENGDQWVLQPSHSLVTWLWWAEGATEPPLASSPGPIWRVAAARLDPQDAATWALWSRYPEALPENVRREILKTASLPTQRDAGWLLDFASTLTKRDLRSARSRQLRHLSLDPVDGFINLRDWARRTAEMCVANPFDPRSGEWTALRIVQQVLEALGSAGADVPLHWSTVFVPTAWTEQDGNRLRWDQWHATVRDSRVTLREDAQGLRDGLRRAETDAEYGRVQEAGLLLLGLLRRNFNWPAAWRSPGMLADAGWVTRTIIHEAHTSSWTTGILEACLLPRQRENLLLSLMFFGRAWWDDDTTNDPPPIFTLKRLARYVGRAIEVLEKGQITVRDHLPRQLVPLRVEQISREEWDVDRHAGLQPEEDDQ
jgi:hypothetical protein